MHSIHYDPGPLDGHLDHSHVFHPGNIAFTSLDIIEARLLSQRNCDWFNVELSPTLLIVIQVGDYIQDLQGTKK